MADIEDWQICPFHCYLFSTKDSECPRHPAVCVFHGLCPPRVQSKDYEDDFIWHQAWEICHRKAVFN